MPTIGPYRTQQDLITEVLANLGVLAAGQAQDPEDIGYVAEKLDSIYRTLAGLEIVYVPDPNNIPSIYFAPLADIVAGEVCTKFGVMPEDFQKLKLAGLGLPPPAGNGIGSGAAAMALKQMGRGKPTYERLATEYF